MVRVDCADRAGIKAILTEHRRTFPDVWTWDELRYVDAFGACFGPPAASKLRLKNELQAFKLCQTQFSCLRADGDGRRLFADTVREASTLLRDAIGTMVTGTQQAPAASLSATPNRT